MRAYHKLLKYMRKKVLQPKRKTMPIGMNLAIKLQEINFRNIFLLMVLSGNYVVFIMFFCSNWKAEVRKNAYRVFDVRYLYLLIHK